MSDKWHKYRHSSTPVSSDLINIILIILFDNPLK